MSKKKRKPAGSVFPNLNSTLGSYDPTIQCIFLDCATREDMEAIKANPKDFPEPKIYGVLLHEIRHYIDHISTLWGHNNILTFQAAGASLLNRNEHKLGPVIEYMKEEYRVKQEQYYQEEYNKVRFDGNPWALKFTTGLKFSADGSVDESRPIVFGKFYEAGGLPICRVPITIASLLEVNAMSVEIKFRMSHMAKTAGDDLQVHAKIFTDDLLSDLVYNQQLVVYNVAAHIVANTFRVKYIEQAYEIASRIATVTLNMPDEYLNLILINEHFRDDEGNWERIHQAVLNKDAGAIFLVLATNYATKFKESSEFILNEFLESNMLPLKEEFTTFVYNKMLFTSATTGDLQHRDFMATYYVNLLVGGTGVFRARGIDGSDMTDNSVLAKNKMYPSIFLADSDVPEPTSSLQNDMEAQWKESPAFRYHYLWELRKRMDVFFEIRGL